MVVSFKLCNIIQLIPNMCPISEQLAQKDLKLAFKISEIVTDISVEYPVLAAHFLITKMVMLCKTNETGLHDLDPGDLLGRSV